MFQDQIYYIKVMFFNPIQVNPRKLSVYLIDAEPVAASLT
jgi:hypothetical protein